MSTLPLTAHLMIHMESSALCINLNSSLQVNLLLLICRDTSGNNIFERSIFVDEDGFKLKTLPQGGQSSSITLAISINAFHIVDIFKSENC